jgi:hypothetical protein
MDPNNLYEFDEQGNFIGPKDGILIESMCRFCYWRVPRGKEPACEAFTPIPKEIYYGYRSHLEHLPNDMGTLFRRQDDPPTKEELHAVLNQILQSIIKD